jgi:hypothetical protein
MIIFSAFVGIFGVAMFIIYRRKYKELPIDVWKPGIAWLRAIIYFSLCNFIIAISGTLEQILTRPFFTLEQISNPYWITYCAFCFIYGFLAYWILWSRMTLTFDRKYYLVPEIVFGCIWGFSTGGILLSFYHLWSLTGLVGLPLYFLSYASMGFWQYFVQDYFWDIYVSPEHDTPKSIIIKTLACHIPNVAITLGFLIIWNNYGIFIMFFVSALVASTIFQKFPAPWAKGDFHAPMVKPGIAGLPHGAGYLGDLNKDKKNNAESFLK